MPEFTTNKSFDDIQEPKVAPEGVYKMMVTKCESAPNKAGTGNNIVVDLTVVDESEELNGITQTLYLPLPNPTDEERKTRQGQPMADWKLQNIKDNVEALGGTIDGDRFDIPDGAMCKANLGIQMSDDGKPFNRIEGRIMAYEPGGIETS